jgi:hypothetical protein
MCWRAARRTALKHSSPSWAHSKPLHAVRHTQATFTLSGTLEPSLPSQAQSKPLYPLRHTQHLSTLLAHSSLLCALRRTKTLFTLLTQSAARRFTPRLRGGGGSRRRRRRRRQVVASCAEDKQVLIWTLSPNGTWCAPVPYLSPSLTLSSAQRRLVRACAASLCCSVGRGSVPPPLLLRHSLARSSAAAPDAPLAHHARPAYPLPLSRSRSVPSRPR